MINTPKSRERSLKESNPSTSTAKTNTKVVTKKSNDKKERPLTKIYLTKKDVLEQAKMLGLFAFNKSLSRYEIIVPIGDYENL